MVDGAGLKGRIAKMSHSSAFTIFNFKIGIFYEILPFLTKSRASNIDKVQVIGISRFSVLETRLK